MKSLPARPSLESLRKQAKKLARDVGAGDADAIARAHEHLPRAAGPLTQRNAQLVIAREYGFAGWNDLVAEVGKRTGSGLDWAVVQAKHAIHNNDLDRLQQLLAEHPALLSWTGDDDQHGLLGFATGAYGDAGTPERERWFTRPASAELLIDAGAVVSPEIVEELLRSRANNLLQLFHRKGLLPRTLKFFGALGDLDGTIVALRESDLSAATEAFVDACAFGNEGVASVILDRLITLDPDLGRRIDDSGSRPAFVKYFVDHKGIGDATKVGVWKAYLMAHVSNALVDGDLTAFVDGLRSNPWMIDDAFVDFQHRLIETIAFKERDEFLGALFDLEPAIVRVEAPPATHAFEYAFTYANAQLVPLLTRIWPLPDDLRTAAGMGDLARVKRWLDESNARRPQHELDEAFAFAVINKHFDVADVLLTHGADVSTRWNSHEPASILHHLVFLPNPYESMQYLIDHGIDMSIHDHRWDSTAIGWARYALKDEAMVQWLEEAERRQARRVSARTAE